MGTCARGCTAQLVVAIGFGRIGRCPEMESCLVGSVARSATRWRWSGTRSCLRGGGALRIILCWSAAAWCRRRRPSDRCSTSVGAQTRWHHGSSGRLPGSHHILHLGGLLRQLVLTLAEDQLDQLDVLAGRPLFSRWARGRWSSLLGARRRHPLQLDRRGLLVELQVVCLRRRWRPLRPIRRPRRISGLLQGAQVEELDKLGDLDCGRLCWHITVI